MSAETKDAFGDRMKGYESAEAGRRFVAGQPVCARLAGKTFRHFTRGMERPFEARLSGIMQDVTTRLVEETNACMGYTQSDEISLVYWSERPESQIFFDGRIQKLNSVLASMCTAWFNELFRGRFQQDKLAYFDCRVWQTPDLVEAANVFLWRELDATKNSISMAARAHYAHRELQDKSGAEMMEMLRAKGVDWEAYPDFFKRGTFVQRRKVLRRFSAEELDALPEKHEARRNPELIVERTEVRRLAMPPFSKVKNRPQVIFEGAEPVV